MNRLNLLQKKRLESQEQTLGKDHPEVARTCSHLGNVYRGLGKYTQSEGMFLRALQIREDTPEIDPRLLAKSYYDLGRFYEGRKDFVLAEPYYLKAIEVAEMAEGKDCKRAKVFRKRLNSMRKKAQSGTER